MAVTRAGRRPQPEGAVDVHPRAIPLGKRDQRLKWIVHAGVDLARLEHYDCRNRRILAQSLLERVRFEVGHLTSPEAEQSNGAIDGTVPLAAR
jgi:hypothetical protein